MEVSEPLGWCLLVFQPPTCITAVSAPPPALCMLYFWRRCRSRVGQGHDQCRRLPQVMCGWGKWRRRRVEYSGVLVKNYCYTAVYHNAVLLCKMPPIIKYNLFCVIAAVYFADSLYLVLYLTTFSELWTSP